MARDGSCDHYIIECGQGGQVNLFRLPEPAGQWIYLTHETGGRLHAGWYRRLPGRRVEVSTRNQVGIAFIESESIESVARRVLEELVRKDVLAMCSPLRGVPRSA